MAGTQAHWFSQNPNKTRGFAWAETRLDLPQAASGNVRAVDVGADFLGPII